MKNFSLFFLLLFWVFTQAFSQDVADLEKNSAQSSVNDALKKMNSLIVELREADADKFIEKSSEYRERILAFIEKKRKICNGEFTSAILDGGVISSDHSIKKLSAEEKEACYHELKVFHGKFLKSYHFSRKKYLEWVHGERLKNLDKAYQASVDDLEKSYQKSGRRRKRR